MATKGKLAFLQTQICLLLISKCFSNMFILAESKNPPINPVLEARITAMKALKAKVVVGKGGASKKPPLAPKIGEQDKQKVTPDHGSKSVADTLTGDATKKKNPDPLLPQLRAGSSL